MKKKLLVIIFILLINSCSSDNNLTNNTPLNNDVGLYNAGMKLLKAKKFDEAIERFTGTRNTIPIFRLVSERSNVNRFCTLR